jgi:signal transduction histidine kinase
VRLADFIESNLELILSEWVSFAKSCGPSGMAMDTDALRDHAAQMLQVIVTDLRTPQTASEQSSKSKGEAEVEEGIADTAAEVHGAGRAESGFTVGEMVAEYRALRASVIRLWTEKCGKLEGDDVQDLMRFNEAIDQSLAESITRYATNVESSKEMFLAILGHDLRTPLGSVIMSAQFMLDTNELVEPHRSLIKRIERAALRMNKMVGDLLDFTRSRLGSGMPITCASMDLGKETTSVVDEVSGANPGSEIKLHTSGNLVGNWDCARISQVMANLLGNAVQHGGPGTLISTTLRGETNEVVAQVHNRGPTILGTEIPHLFDPFKRLSGARATSGPSESLGLGLYIAERIVTAHGGSISVESTDEGGTFFTVRLPR